MEPATTAFVYDQITLPSMSLGATTVMLGVILPLSAVLGFWAGAARRRSVLAQGKQVDTQAGETTITAILGILGLLIAFTFGNALGHTQDAKASIVNEAAALGTVFLRADYLPEPGRSELREAIYDYAQTRVVPKGDSLDTLGKVQDFLDVSLTAQAKLWPLTLTHTAEPVSPPIATFFAASMNDALDAHLDRMRVQSQPVAEPTMLMVLAAALSALFMVGNRSGLIGRVLTWRTFVLSAFIFVIMVMTLDTQRTSDGFVQVDDSTLRATVVDMQIALGL